MTTPSPNPDDVTTRLRAASLPRERQYLASASDVSKASLMLEAADLIDLLRHQLAEREAALEHIATYNGAFPMSTMQGIARDTRRSALGEPSMTNLHETDRLVDTVVTEEMATAGGYALAHMVQGQPYRVQAEAAYRAMRPREPNVSHPLASPALTAMGGKAEPVKVKPLVWSDGVKGTFGHTGFGLYYYIDPTENGVIILERHEGSSVVYSKFSDAARAKDAAQHHFNACVLSALE